MTNQKQRTINVKLRVSTIEQMDEVIKEFGFESRDQLIEQAAAEFLSHKDKPNWQTMIDSLKMFSDDFMEDEDLP